MQENQILQVVYDALDQVNRTLDPDHAVPKSPDTILIGEGGQLDSLGFVNLAVAIEENLSRFGGGSTNVVEAVLQQDLAGLSVARLVTYIEQAVRHSAGDRPR